MGAEACWNTEGMFHTCIPEAQEAGAAPLGNTCMTSKAAVQPEAVEAPLET